MKLTVNIADLSRLIQFKEAFMSGGEKVTVTLTADPSKKRSCFGCYNCEAELQLNCKDRHACREKYQAKMGVTQ